MLKKCGFPETRWLDLSLTELDLGLKLDLLKTTLDAIEGSHPRDVHRCLVECLSRWLSKADSVVIMSGPPSFDSLSDALCAIDEIAVADELDQEKSELL